MDDRAVIPSSFAEQFARNLAALRSLQPQLAGRLAELPIPATVQFVTGRDGHPTFLVPDSFGRLGWLGGSSMATISSEEQFGRWQPTGGNVVLPRILTGLELLGVASRLEPHCAIFVIEPDCLAIKLVLHLRDFAELLSSGRLILMHAEEQGSAVEQAFVDFFSCHPGYEMPLHMLTVPQSAPAATLEVQRRMERAAGRVQGLQAELIQGMAERLDETYVNRPPDPQAGRVALVSAAAGPRSLHRAARMERGLQALRIDHVSCVPDRPDKCHLVARMRTILEFRPDVVLFSESHPGPGRRFIPRSLPVVCWYSAAAQGIRPIENGAGTGDMFIAESARAAAELVSAGAAERCVRRTSPGADNAGCLYKKSAAAVVPVAVWCDLPDDRPESAEINLDSHRRLWQALQSAARREGVEYRDSKADSLLRQAEKTCGVAIQDSALREAFLQVLRTRIAQCAVAASVVKQLIRCGHKPRVFGEGWASRLPHGAAHAGPILHGPGRFEALATTDWVVLPNPAADSTELVLDALLAGCGVIIRAQEASWSASHPGLSELAPFVSTFRNVQDLEKRLSTATRKSPSDSRGPRELIERRHTMAGRLRAVLNQAGVAGNTTSTPLTAATQAPLQSGA